MLKAFIEIPAGDERRRHMKNDKSGLIDFGPIKEEIPVNNGIMPVNYGYILKTINKEEQDEYLEELDVLVFSKRTFSIGEEVIIEPIALLEREDRDHKIVSIEVGNSEYREWNDIPEEMRKLIFDYFGHKSPITCVRSKKEAVKLIADSLV